MPLPTLSPSPTERKAERKPELCFRPSHRRRRSADQVSPSPLHLRHGVFRSSRKLSPILISPLVHRSRQNSFSSSSPARTSLSAVRRPPVASVLLLHSDKSPLPYSFSCVRDFAVCFTEPQKPPLHHEPPPLFAMAPPLRATVGLATGTHGTARRRETHFGQSQPPPWSGSPSTSTARNAQAFLCFVGTETATVANKSPNLCT